MPEPRQSSPGGPALSVPAPPGRAGRTEARASATETGLDAARFEGVKVSGDVVTWSFATGPGPADAPFSGTIGAAYKAAIEQGFQAWAAASGLTFEEVPDSASSDIRIGWGDFDTASGVVGYTSFSQAGGTIAPGTVVFSVNLDGTVASIRMAPTSGIRPVVPVIGIIS